MLNWCGCAHNYAIILSLPTDFLAGTSRSTLWPSDPIRSLPKGNGHFSTTGLTRAHNYSRQLIKVVIQKQTFRSVYISNRSPSWQQILKAKKQKTPINASVSSVWFPLSQVHQRAQTCRPKALSRPAEEIWVPTKIFKLFRWCVNCTMVTTWPLPICNRNLCSVSKNSECSYLSDVTLLRGSGVTGDITVQENGLCQGGCWLSDGVGWHSVVENVTVWPNILCCNCAIRVSVTVHLQSDHWKTYITSAYQWHKNVGNPVAPCILWQSC